MCEKQIAIASVITKKSIFEYLTEKQYCQTFNIVRFTPHITNETRYATQFILICTLLPFFPKHIRHKSGKNKSANTSRTGGEGEKISQKRAKKEPKTEQINIRIHEVFIAKRQDVVTSKT